MRATYALGLALLVAGCASPSVNELDSAASQQQVITVTKVVDGDTVDLSDGRRVRILGIDTPERGDCGFTEATDFASERLLNKEVVPSADPTQSMTDRYNRSLLYISVDGVDFSVSSATAGWARNYIFNNKPVLKEPEIRAGVEQAQSELIGIWGSLCNQIPTPTEKDEVPQTPDVIQFNNCAEVRTANRAPIRTGEPGFNPNLDRDGDGVACEVTTGG